MPRLKNKTKEMLEERSTKLPNGCWEWSLCTDRATGYGVTRHGGKKVNAHRLSYELFVGPIPEGLCLDHLCRNRLCINPQHLEAVTTRVNIIRGESPSAINAAKTHCKKGHEFTGENLVFDGEKRRCRICTNTEARDRWRAKQSVDPSKFRRSHRKTLSTGKALTNEPRRP